MCPTGREAKFTWDNLVQAINVSKHWDWIIKHEGWKTSEKNMVFFFEIIGKPRIDLEEIYRKHNSFYQQVWRFPADFP